MGELQSTKMNRYLGGMQSTFYRHSSSTGMPGVDGWQSFLHSENSYAALQFTGKVKPSLCNVRQTPYIPIDLKSEQNQINTLISSKAANYWTKNKQVPNVKERPILGNHNHDNLLISNAINNEQKKSVSTNTSNINIIDWPPRSSESKRETSTNSRLKRPLSSTRLSQINSENEQNFQQKSNQPLSTLSTNPIELHVTNVDQKVDSLELKEILLAAFKEHVLVLSISIFAQSDGNLAASVKVPSIQDAQYVISQLHRRKVGHKRIMISYTHSGSLQNPQIVKSQIYSLLSEVPGYVLPLFTFVDLFQNRYHTSLSISELYRMRDVCIIMGEKSRRTIHLNTQYKNTYLPQSNFSKNEIGQLNMVVPYCILHGSQQLGCEKGWAEQELPPLPNIRVKLSEFSANIQELLHSHNNFLPLASLMDCYAAEFKPLTIDETGVPIEHLVTWVPNVELALSLGNGKYLCFAQNKSNSLESTESNVKKFINPSLADDLHLFSRELVEVLKKQPQNCPLKFNRFIPAYHHHFGRQCRVADYGFTKLIDLFEALPNVIQVIGEGNKRVVVLAYRAQIRRFTSDLLRVLKSQSNKQFQVSELSTLFESTLGRAFDPVDYGLCYLEDLLSQLSDNVVLVSGIGPITTIAIPKKDQTSVEVERTKQFAIEVVELLSQSPQCTMLFSKFIPAYHHHYGHQCRVSDYGFTKLIELFKAIPDIVKIEDNSEKERYVTLTNEKKMAVLRNQIIDMVNSNFPPGLALSSLSQNFLRRFGYVLKPSAYGCEDIHQLIKQLLGSVKVIEIDNEIMLVPIDDSENRQLSLRIFRVLMVVADAKMTCSEFQQCYQSLYNESCDLELWGNSLNNFIKITFRGITKIELTSLQLFARNIYKLLYISDGKISFKLLEPKYFNMFGERIIPSKFNCQSLSTLIKLISHVVIQTTNEDIELNVELESVGIPLPSRIHTTSQDLVLNFLQEYHSEIEDTSQSVSNNKQITPKRKTLKRTFEDIESEGEKAHGNWERVWKKGFNDDYNNSYNQVPIINLPEPCTPPDPDECATLLSPYKTLLPATVNPFCYSTPHKRRIISPHPSELPLPLPYFINCNSEASADENDSADSGLVTSAIDLAPDSDSNSNSSILTLSNNEKRKIRLAAQFNTPID
uniref:HTH OST-type domain-containing protein n=2 Tax=Clastoptera arizonana TaxID=38151 RepID=A0A1B6CMW8_9HEMI